MNARIKNLLLGMAALNTILVRESADSPALKVMTDGITNTLLTACFDLEREANGQPARTVALDECDTQDMVPVTVDDKVIVDREAS